MPAKSQAKHKFCRRIGYCLWNDPTCPSVKRPFCAGPHGPGKRVKLSTYGELLLEKQKLRNYYGISEKQLQIAYAKAKAGLGATHEKLFRSLEQRLDAMVFRAGFARTIFAAKQMVNHGHILVDGKRVDRASYVLREGQTFSFDVEKSPKLAELIKANPNADAPAYLEVSKDDFKATLVRAPQLEEIPVQVKIMSVIEHYSR